MYVTADIPETTLLTALQRGGVDVNEAMDSGALSFYSVKETYLRDGTFEPDEMIESYANAIESATAEFSALRVAAETTWLEDEATTMQDLLEYDAKVNDLFEYED